MFEPRESELDVRQGDPSAWLALDSVYLADGARGLHDAARLCGRARRDRACGVSRSFAMIRQARSYDEVEPSARPAPPGAMRACGRQYSLALLALLDALAAEPTRSPLATSAPLDDLRATAFLVAGATVAEPPNRSLIEQAIRLADHRLVDLRVPLQATGYLAARDALGRMVETPAGASRDGAP